MCIFVDRYRLTATQPAATHGLTIKPTRPQRQSEMIIGGENWIDGCSDCEREVCFFVFELAECLYIAVTCLTPNLGRGHTVELVFSSDFRSLNAAK